ncbi:MAG TPA: hypothetical protein PLK40_07765, partial [Bacteroidaceae bacterium]|nr:hypothetical protein [Bacteroidaceae bacterium]
FEGDETTARLLEELESITPKTRSYSPFYDPDLDENFSSNMYNIRELPVTIKARGKGRKNGLYWYTRGKNKELSLTDRTWCNRHRFFIKVLPISCGIPYMIYSCQENLPLLLGQYSSNPENKIVYTAPNEDFSSSSAAWDLQPCHDHKGYFSIKSNLYLKQAEEGNPWSIYYPVLEVGDNNKLVFSKYEERATQQFLLQLDNKFELASIDYDESSAVITNESTIPVTLHQSNTYSYEKKHSIVFDKEIDETSRFNEKEGYLKFNFTNPNVKFARPTVVTGKVITPEENAMGDQPIQDALYKLSYLEKITRQIHYTIPVDIPAKTLATVIVNLKMYTVSVDYTVYAKFEDREVKFSGTWHGNVVQDPSTVSPEILVTYTPLNTTGGDTPIAGGN